MSRSAYAASSVPTATPDSMTRTVSSELMVPTLLQNQRATRRLRRPNRPLGFQSRGEVQRGCSAGSWLEGAGRRLELAGEEIQAIVEIGTRQARPSGPALRISSKAASTSCSPAQAMPINCWQTTSSGARTMRKRLDAARRERPGP